MQNWNNINNLYNVTYFLIIVMLNAVLKFFTFLYIEIQRFSRIYWCLFSLALRTHTRVIVIEGIQNFIFLVIAIQQLSRIYWHLSLLFKGAKHSYTRFIDSSYKEFHLFKDSNAMIKQYSLMIYLFVNFIIIIYVGEMLIDALL